MSQKKENIIEGKGIEIEQKEEDQKMNSVEKTENGKEATDLALSELNVKEDDAIIEVLDEGNKGIFDYSTLAWRKSK